MTRAWRSYNPGRDDRHGTRRGLIWERSQFRFGPGQGEANRRAIESTGRPLPWRMYPVAMDAKCASERLPLESLAASWPEVNRIRIIDGLRYLLMRLPNGLYDDWPAMDELPGRPIPLTAAQRGRLVEGIEAAGPELKAAGLIDTAARIGLALMDRQVPVADALRERIPDAELVDRLTAVAAIVPAVEQLLEYVR